MVQDIAIPLLHLNVVDDPHPRCPVHKEDEDVGVVTEDADCLDSVHRSIQHATAQCRLDEAVKPSIVCQSSVLWLPPGSRSAPGMSSR